MKTSFAICNFCDAICGLEIEHSGRDIRRIRGDMADPFSRGHICPKGSAHKDLLNDPDRLRHPMRRIGSEWHEISWREAVTETARQLVAAQREGGRDAAALYYGNPMGHNYQAMLALLPLIRYLGSRNTYTSNSVDAYPRMLVSRLLYGNQAILPVPDVERTEMLVIMGANPMVSHGSVMGIPDTKRRLSAIGERGGEIVVIDPRRTETAAIANEHLAIRPGTDAYLLLSVLNTLERDGLIQLRHLEPIVENLDQVLDLAAQYSPDRTEGVTGVSASAARKLARRFGETERAVWYGRMGTSAQEFGTLTTWLIDVVNIATGKLDSPGGPMFTTPAVDLAALSKVLREPGKYGRWRSRVAGLAEFNAERPVAALVDELETPGRGQIKAMLIVAGNPVLTNPGSARLEKALGDIGFLASIDYYINETNWRADIVMPPSLALESDQYPALEHSIAIRNSAHFSPAVFAREPGTRHELEILTSLISAIASERRIPNVVARAAGGAIKWAIGSGVLLDVLLRLGPQRLSLSELKRQPHGIDLGPLEPHLPQILQTPGGGIDLAPSLVMADVLRLAERFGRSGGSGALGGGMLGGGVVGVPSGGPGGVLGGGATETSPGPVSNSEILLISRRTLKGMNSWMHNLRSLSRGRESCTIQLNPLDAKERGIADGDKVVVESAEGMIEVTAEVTDAVMAGVASMTIGWGHDSPGAQLSVASGRPGSNINVVVDPGVVDRPSGTSVVNGVPVKISAVS
ncbi:MAG: hypothetical protein DCC49_02115 [Acidobacteria bacterium]|nr:MAG: hypothetical protein DCC49_02115 [Acidobacteriota bacterium]